MLELVVVTSILALLSAIIALAVGGHTSQSRTAVRGADDSTMQRAVEQYAGEHPQARFPTLNGCLPGHSLDLVSKQCFPSGSVPNPARSDSNNLEFVIAESLTVDLNEDGDMSDSFPVVPLIWDKGFRSTLLLPQDEVFRHFVPDFVPRPPKGAFDFLGGLDDSWEDGQNRDPDGLNNIESAPGLIKAPIGLGPGENSINPESGQVPIWVIGVFQPKAGVEVRNLRPE